MVFELSLLSDRCVRLIVSGIAEVVGVVIEVSLSFDWVIGE